MNKATKGVDVFCRYFICLLMLVYGVVKIFQGQFYTDNYWKDIPLGQLTGLQLTWSFYSYYPPYETLLGAIEVTVGLLVFFKRTTRLGIILFVPVMANVVLINMFFNIGALVTAFPLLLAGLTLFFIHLKSYLSFFFVKPVQNGKSTWLQILPKAGVISVGCLLALVVMYNNKFRIKEDETIRGAWTSVGQAAIKKIYFEKGDVCVIKNNSDSLDFYTYQTNPNHTITLSNEHSALFSWKNLSYVVNGDSLTVFDGGKKALFVKN